MTAPPDETQPAFSPALAERCLEVIEHDILPLTERGVAAGDKIFGAAVLRRDDWALVSAATNEEHTSGCPLWHGEMTALRDYHKIAARPPAAACLLLSTHEPCPMCASAIAWCGIPQVLFLFDYQATEEQFAIPHDIRMLRALFAPATGLARRNDFFTAAPLAAFAPDQARLRRLAGRYEALSAVYQAGKAGNALPLK